LQTLQKIFFTRAIYFYFSFASAAQRFALAAVGRAWIKLREQDSVRV